MTKHLGVGRFSALIDCTPSSPPSARALHFFFDSRVWAIGGGFRVGVSIHCGEHFFCGGDVVSTQRQPAPHLVSEAAAVRIPEWGEFTAFGAEIRADNGNAPNQVYAGPIRSVHVKANGSLHLHGGEIDVKAPGFNGTSVVGLEVDAAATIAHTPGTAFGAVAAAGPHRLFGSPSSTSATRLRRISALPP